MRKIQVNVAGVSTLVAENLLTQKSNGDYEKHYNADMSPDTTTIDAENLVKLIQDGEALVDGYIQAEVDKYNEANDVKFNSVDSCNKYTAEWIVYEHKQFCIDIVAFNVAVWESARANQATAIANGLTAEEFIATLPKFGV